MASDLFSSHPHPGLKNSYTDRSISFAKPIGDAIRTKKVSAIRPIAPSRQPACPYQKLHLNWNLSGGENRYRIDALQ
jgi:hypothetical protein